MKALPRHRPPLLDPMTHVRSHRSLRGLSVLLEHEDNAVPVRS